MISLKQFLDFGCLSCCNGARQITPANSQVVMAAKGLFLKKVSIFQECLISDGIYPNVEEDLLGNQSCAAEDGSALQFHKHENLRLHVSSLSWITF